jgi:hypothetical protein
LVVLDDELLDGVEPEVELDDEEDDEESLELLLELDDSAGFEFDEDESELVELAAALVFSPVFSPDSERLSVR